MPSLGVLVAVALASLQLLQMAEPVKGDGQYTVVGPGTIHSNRLYNVAVAVHHTKEPVTLSIGITGRSCNLTQTVELPKADEFKQLSFKLPPLREGEYNLTAEGVSGLVFKNTTKLNWAEFKPIVRIQTDKGKYKPGDTINYRVIFLDENLRPDTPTDDVVISFEDNKRNRIQDVKHFKTTSGVYTGKFELSEFAALGTWNLFVKNANVYSDERVYFEVEKYVLPKYKVSLEATEHVSVKDGDMQVVVRANYTYGKPVNGKVLLSIKLEDSTIWKQVNGMSERTEKPGHTMISTVDMVSGKAKFNLNVKEFADYLPYKTSASYLLILATVEEDFTGVKLNETSGFQLFPYRYEMSCNDYTRCYQFHPDKEEEQYFKFAHVDGTPLKDTKAVVKAKFTEGIRHTYGWYGPGSEQEKPELPEIEKKTFTFESHMNESGIAVFKVKLPDLPDLKNFTRYYTTELEYADETREVFTVYPYREPPKHEDPPVDEEEEKRKKEWFKAEVQRDENKWSLKQGAETQIKLNSSRPLSYFVYNIIGRGNVLHTERVVLPEPQQTYNISLTPTFYMAPHARVYVYYVDETGEFRFAEDYFHVDVELQNQIEVSAPAEVKPGTDVALEIKTAPKSFVGLLAVDQSVLLLGNNNDLQKDSFSWRLSRYDTSTPWQGGYSYYPGERSGVVTMTNANFFYNRTVPNHHIQGLSNSVEAMRKTQMADVATFSAAGHAGPPLGGAPMEGGSAAPAVRKNFVETWIFADIENTESEVFKWVKTIPDTITNWVLSAFAIHPDKGLGVTNEQTNIKTFQPFFVSVRLPYSVKRGEVISVPALVFNYLPKDLDVEVTLNNPDDEYEFVDPSNEVIGEQKRTQTVRVPANEAAGVSFLVRPKIIGNILLKFTATSPIAGDAVHKTLKVVPEGVTQYVNRAFFVNLKQTGEFKDSFDLELPQEYVKDSQHVEFGIVGDLLGPVIKNLEELLRLPSGCGEQTMSKLVPNYLVRDYLNSIKKMTPALESRIKRNLEQGYQSIMHYRHDDGSFSSFGPGRWRDEDPPRNGSTWLTAYVLRSLAHLAPQVHVDEKLLKEGYEFLLNQQAENGSFQESGEYFYGSQRSSLTLTANALLALLEQQPVNQAAIDKAAAYLSANVEQSETVLPRAIATYALQKAKAMDATKHVASLKALAKVEDDRTWWTESEESFHKGHCMRWWCWIRSNDVEITSYALLTLLESEPADSVLNSIRWMVAQRNNYGGFASTQDTVVGLQALIKFAQKSDYEAALWDVTVANRGQREKTETLKLTDDNGLLLQRVEFPQGTTSLDFGAKGTGAALIQISYQYNIVEKEPKASFKIKTTIKPDAPSAKLELDVCVEYVEEGKSKASNMAILEVSLPSGYTADEESFKSIKNVARVRLVETKNADSMVVIYFESLPKNEPSCIPIEAYKTHAVANQKPAPIVLYDYYDTNKKATDYYQVESKLCDLCEDDDCKRKC